MVPRRTYHFIAMSVISLLILQIATGSLGPDMNEKKLEFPEVMSMSLNFDFSLQDFTISNEGGYDMTSSDDLEIFTEPGEPLLPMRTATYGFEKHTEILDVVVSHESRVRIEGTFDIIPTPEPLSWDTIALGKHEKNPEVYDLDEDFPGSSFSFRVGEDNHAKYLYVHFYPIQYNPRRGEISVITNAVIEILYQHTNGEEPLADDSTAECIIITPPELYPEALQLSIFHEDSLGVLTSVVNTTWIESNYSEAPDPPFEGYSDSMLPGWAQIWGYDYSLAKKTVNFLDDQSAHPNMKSVLLYGNAELVPPSYYWYDSWVGSFMPYQGWIPTDFFYSSPDYDLTPNYDVGRLPVDGNSRAQDMNQKIINWFGNITGDWYKRAAIAGGRPFGTEFYIGELINMDTINRGYFDGFDITKIHATDGRFNRLTVLEALKGEYGFFYEIGHGNGDALIVNDSSGPGETVEVSDVMSLPPNSNVSVFVSIACMNGAYDNTLMMNKPFMSSMSIGESLLFSPAGAIAYVGGVRTNSGTPIGTIEEGEVIVTDEQYMAHLLTDFWEAFHEYGGTLGNISRNALDVFSSNLDMGNIQNKRAFFEYVLLGDPVLPMTHPNQQRYALPNTEIDIKIGERDFGSPTILFGKVPIVPLQKPNTVNITTDSPIVNIKIIDAEFDVTIEYGNCTTTGDEAKYGFTPSRNALLLFRAEGEDGKEAWQYMDSQFIPDHPKAPVLMLARLNGAANEDVVISWYKSSDEGDPDGPTRYEIHRSNSIFGPFNKIGEVLPTGQPTYVYVDAGRGHGDTSNYFYYVLAVNTTDFTARSYYAGKFTQFLTQGWNLVSIPLEQDDRDPANVFRTLEYKEMGVYDASDAVDPWKRHSTIKPYHDLNRVDHKMGIWVEVATAGYFTTAGLVPESTAIVLKEGWNLVGYPTFDEKPVEIELSWVNFETVEGYEPASQPYCLRTVDLSDPMATGSAYWIKVTREVLWVVRNPA